MTYLKLEFTQVRTLQLARLPRLAGINAITAANSELFSETWSEGPLRCLGRGGDVRVAPRISSTKVNSRHHGISSQGRF